jgi:hypothetical protein
MVRKLLPFSGEVQEVWMKRRQLSKEYDSYQWQKLLWFGIGMAGALSSSEASGGPGYALTGFCLVSGAIGAIFWQFGAASKTNKF